ncbi:hypothetical protein TNIN_97131, partial [Trichonephila inaurata madagascariensis]
IKRRKLEGKKPKGTSKESSDDGFLKKTVKPDFPIANIYPIEIDNQFCLFDLDVEQPSTANSEPTPSKPKPLPQIMLKIKRNYRE